MTANEEDVRKAARIALHRTYNDDAFTGGGLTKGDFESLKSLGEEEEWDNLDDEKEELLGKFEGFVSFILASGKTSRVKKLRKGLRKTHKEAIKDEVFKFDVQTYAGDETIELDLSESERGSKKSKKKRKSQSNARASTKKAAPKKKIKMDQEELLEYHTQEKEKFEKEKESILSRVPLEHQAKWGEIAFAKWSKTWRPVVIQSPYSVQPGEVRDMWMKMFQNCRLDPSRMTFLCYWYGTENDSEAYTFQTSKTLVMYKEGVKQGYNELPPGIQRKLSKKKGLTKGDREHVEGLKIMNEHLDLPKEQRYARPVQELHDLYLGLDEVEADPQDDDDEEDCDNGPLLSDPEDGAEEDNHNGANEIQNGHDDNEHEKQNVQELEEHEKPEEVEKSKKRPRKSDVVEPPKKKPKLAKSQQAPDKIEKPIEAEKPSSEVDKNTTAVDTEMDFENDLSEDNDEESAAEPPPQEDDEDHVLEQELKSPKKVKKKKPRPPPPQQQQQQTEDSKNRKRVDRNKATIKKPKREVVDDDHLLSEEELKKKKKREHKRNREREHTAFRRCRQRFTQVIEKWEDALKRSAVKAVTECLKDIRGDVDMLTAPFIEVFNLAPLMKDSKAVLKGNEQALALRKDVWEKMKVVYETKKKQVPSGFQRPERYPKDKNGNRQIPPEKKDGANGSTHLVKEMRISKKVSADSAREEKKMSKIDRKESSPTIQDVKVKKDDSKKERQSLLSEPVPRTDAATETNESTPASSKKATPPVVVKKKQPSLKSLLSGPKINRPENASNRSTPPAKSPTAEVNHSASSCKVPDWLRREPPPDATLESNETRQLALELLYEAAEHFPRDNTRPKVAAKCLEAAIYAWSREQKETNQSQEKIIWKGKYWKKLHHVVAALCGKFNRSRLPHDIASGKYRTAEDVVKLSFAEMEKFF